MDEEAVEEGAVLKIAAVALGLASLLPVVEADIDDETIPVGIPVQLQELCTSLHSDKIKGILKAKDKAELGGQR